MIREEGSTQDGDGPIEKRNTGVAVLEGSQEDQSKKTSLSRITAQGVAEVIGSCGQSGQDSTESKKESRAIQQSLITDFLIPRGSGLVMAKNALQEGEDGSRIPKRKESLGGKGEEKEQDS